MTKTFKELQEVDQLVGGLYSVDKTLKDTKFGYAYKRFTEKFYVPVIKEFQDRINDVRIENALENPTTKEILTDEANPRGYKYSKEGLKKVIEAEKKIVDEFDNREIEIEVWKSSFIPEGLTEYTTELLTGIVL